MTLASFINRYEDHGGGDLLSFSWTWEDAPPWAQTGEVETLDGFVLALAPWAVRSVRFDESLSRFHGYDLDYCLQVREAGRKVVTADFRAIHHREIEMLPDPEEWIEAHINVAEKWDDRMPRDRHRAGRLGHGRCAPRRSAIPPRRRRTRRCSKLEARARELERGIAETRESLSWRADRSAALARAAARAGAPPGARAALRPMIAFGSVITDPEAYRRFAEPGIRRAVEPDSQVHAFSAVGTVCRGYNLLLEVAAGREDLEALVLLDPRAEIADPDFCAKARDALRAPEVAVAGPVGAKNVSTIAWWEGDVGHPRRLITAITSTGGGEMAGYAWARPSAPLGEVDSVDGSLLVLSPWAVRTLRFDESLPDGARLRPRLLPPGPRGRPQGGHGRPPHDPSPHARAARRRRRVGSKGHIKLAEKWDGRWPGRSGEPVDWKPRARRAEAEREAARTMAYSSTLRVDAEVLALERTMAEMTESLSWRVTAPLRRLNRMRRRSSALWLCGSVAPGCSARRTAAGED